MKKYNLSNIMKNAWNKYRQAQKWVSKLSFSECLRRAWKDAKKALETAALIEKISQRRFEIGQIFYGSLLFMRRAVVAESGCFGWVISGKTYRVKGALKDMGFRWDCEARNWYTEDADVAAKFATYHN